MGKDWKCNITPVIEATFGPIMVPYTDCMYCFAARDLRSCDTCRFMDELQKAGKEYVNEKIKILEEEI